MNRIQRVQRTVITSSTEDIVQERSEVKAGLRDESSQEARRVSTGAPSLSVTSEKP